MRYLIPAALLMFTPAIALAQEHRELGAHVHGTGTLNIAIEDGRIMAELEVPGMDIAGFEHAAETEEDKAAVEAAIERLSQPLELFVPTETAQCTVADAQASLVTEEHEHEHEEGEHHDEAGVEPGHDEHEEEGGHTEFRAEYAIDCAAMPNLTGLAFAYFELFPNAQELDIQLAGPNGATSAEVTRNAPDLDLTPVL